MIKIRVNNRIYNNKIKTQIINHNKKKIAINLMIKILIKNKIHNNKIKI